MPRFADAALGIVAIVAVALDAGRLRADEPGAAVQDAEPAAAGAPAVGAGRDLYLEVFVNGRSTNLIVAFREDAAGRLAATPEELAAVGVAAAQAGPDGRAALDDLAGVEHLYDEARQALFLTVPDAARTLAAHSATARTRAPEVDPSGHGAFANYSLFASAGSDFSSLDDAFHGVSAAVDAHAYGPLGVISQSGVARLGADLEVDLIRFDTYWSRSDPATMLTHRVGDLIAGGLSWSRPVRLGGVQIQRNFALRPDLITRPLPSFRGSAAVPTTADVYIDNVLRASVEVGDGPFVLRDLPASVGAGSAQVVLRDAQGREVVAQLPFYASPALVAPGLLDFSVEAGFPRRGFADASFDYADELFAAATLRYGTLDWLTLEGHAEVGESLLAGGAGAVFALWSVGEGGVALAASEAEGRSGLLAAASIRLQRGRAAAFARSQRTVGDYRDIAAVSAPRNDEFGFLDAAPPRALDQIGFSFSTPFDPVSVSASFTQRVSAAGARNRIASLSAARPLGRRASLHVSSFADVDGGGFGVFAGVSFPLGGDRRGSTGVRAGPDGPTAFAETSRAATREPGAVGWRAQVAVGEDMRLAGEVIRRGDVAEARAAVATTPDGLTATASLDGSVGIAGGAAFAAHRIDDALAVVDIGTPGVEVFHENRSVGVTDAGGRRVVPHLRAYQRNRISIDPNGLPAAAVARSATVVVSPHARSGVTVDFGVATAPAAALIAFALEDGGPVPPGSRGRLVGGETEFVVGHGGEAYVEGLSARNAVTIRMPRGRVCTASFDHAPEDGAQPRLGSTTCRF